MSNQWCVRTWHCSAVLVIINFVDLKRRLPSSPKIIVTNSNIDRSPLYDIIPLPSHRKGNHQRKRNLKVKFTISFVRSISIKWIWLIRKVDWIVIDFRHSHKTNFFHHQMMITQTITLIVFWSANRTIHFLSLAFKTFFHA